MPRRRSHDFARELTTASTPSTRPLTHMPPLPSILRTSAGSVDLWSSVSRTAVPRPTARRSSSISGSGRRGGAFPTFPCLGPAPPSPPRNSGSALAVLDERTARASPALAARTVIDSSRPVRSSKSGDVTQHTAVAPLVVTPARRLWMSVRRKARSNAVRTGSRSPPGVLLGEPVRLLLAGECFPLPSFSGAPTPRASRPWRTTWVHSSATFLARWSSR